MSLVAIEKAKLTGIGDAIRENLGTLFPSFPSTAGNGTKVGTCDYKDTSGKSYNGITFYQNDTSEFVNNFSFSQLVPYATADVLADYNISDYSCVSIGSTTYATSRSNTSTSASLIYTITVTNNTENDITVGAFRFRKNVRPTNSSGIKSVMLYSYYLDSPLTIHPSDYSVVSVEFRITMNESTLL